MRHTTITQEIQQIPHRRHREPFHTLVPLWFHNAVYRYHGTLLPVLKLEHIPVPLLNAGHHAAHIPGFQDGIHRIHGVHTLHFAHSAHALRVCAAPVPGRSDRNLFTQGTLAALADTPYLPAHIHILQPGMERIPDDTTGEHP